jgi:hypothetical protein
MLGAIHMDLGAIHAVSLGADKIRARDEFVLGLEADPRASPPALLAGLPNVVSAFDEARRIAGVP